LLAGLFLYFGPDHGGVKQKIPNGASLADAETRAASAQPVPEAAGQLTTKEEQPVQDDFAPPDGEIQDAAPVVGFQDFLAENNGLFPRHTSVNNLLKQWGITKDLLPDVSETVDDAAFFSMAASRHGMVVTPVNQDLDRIIRLNLPAVLKFHHPSAETPLYLTAVKALPDAMVFLADSQVPEVETPYDQVLKYWSGSAFVFWKNFYNYRGIIPVDAPGESVITLKLHLRDMGFSHIEISGKYDLGARSAVMAIQARNGIPVDGFVGPLTKIVLYNEKSSLSIPHLWEQIKLPDKIPAMKMVNMETMKNDPDRELSSPAPGFEQQQID
jgi:general secretion pathway protein A